MKSYQLFQCDWSRHGGGVCLYVNELFSVFFTCVDDQMELLWEKIYQSYGENHLVGVFYLPPNYCDLDLSQLEDAIFSITHTVNDSVLMGDFNVDLSTHSAHTDDFTALICGFWLVTLLTRVTSSNTNTYWSCICVYHTLTLATQLVALFLP